VVPQQARVGGAGAAVGAAALVRGGGAVVPGGEAVAQGGEAAVLGEGAAVPGVEVAVGAAAVQARSMSSGYRLGDRDNWTKFSCLPWAIRQEIGVSCTYSRELSLSLGKVRPHLTLLRRPSRCVASLVSGRERLVIPHQGYGFGKRDVHQMNERCIV
jgi:hypothetical protein